MRALPYETFTERNRIVKDASKVDVLFGLCYPSTYRAGMSGLAVHLFYEALNLRADTSCERYFRFDTRSPINSIESGRALGANHVIGFSLTYEEDIIGLVQMIEMGGIPVFSEERGDEDPVILVGGPVVSANPEPYADLVDAFVIGEGDRVVHEIIDVVSQSNSRNEALEELNQVQGVYVPRYTPSKVSRLIMPSLEDLFHPTRQILPIVPEGSPLEPVFGQAFLAEVSRGCGHACAFCLVGHICRPRRIRSVNTLRRIIEEGMMNAGTQKVALIASSLGDHDGLEELAAWIVDNGWQLSVPSLRADRVTFNILELLKRGGQRTLTIAPETGTMKLRRKIGKGLTDEAILEAVENAKKAGMRNVKAYYIIGLPEEDSADVLSIADMTRRMAESTGLRITVSVNPFIPKAQTRWERKPQEALEKLREKLRLLERALIDIPKVTFETLDPRRARIQASLSIGDRSLGKVIGAAAKYGGLGGWRRAEKETGIAFFGLASDDSRASGKLPWHFIS